MRDKLRLLMAVIAADFVLFAVLVWALGAWTGAGSCAAGAPGSAADRGRGLAAEAPQGAEGRGAGRATGTARGAEGRGAGRAAGTAQGAPGRAPAAAANPNPKPGDGMVSEKRPDGAKCVALTFDDGPNKECTKDLLDGLKARGAKATFFLMGENIPGNEDLVRRMKEEGHLIGNHSYRHIQLTKAGSKAVCDAVDQTSRMIEEITGERPQYLRPPYGDWNEDLECKVDMTTVLWSVDSLDWKLQNRQKIVKRVLKDVKDGDIILMHDIFPTSVEAALEIIDTLSGQGYTFVTVDEVLID